MQNGKKKVSNYIGSVLIILSLVGFIFIFYPLLPIYIIPPKIQTLDNLPGTYITIPKISAQAPITENVDPFNSAVYQDVLKRGVAQAKGTSLPGENGTMFIFAHSSGAPWELTRYNTIFLRLADLKNGDEIIIQKNSKKYIYKVNNKKVVDPSEISYILQNKTDQLILQTCSPIGTDWKRLLIFAMPVDGSLSKF